MKTKYNCFTRNAAFGSVATLMFGARVLNGLFRKTEKSQLSLTPLIRRMVAAAGLGLGLILMVPTAAHAAQLTARSVVNGSAKCVDGTTPKFYFSAGNSDVWLIFLAGSNSCKITGSLPDVGKLTDDCRTLEEVVEWCDPTADPVDKCNEAQASAPPTNNTITKGGIFDSWALNLAPNVTASLVYIDNCTGDNWKGDASYQDVKKDPACVDPGCEKMDVYFNGKQLINDVIHDLRHDMNVGEPTLNTNDIVLFAGQSSGGQGILHNVNRICDHLYSNANVADCRAVVASFMPQRKLADVMDGANHIQDSWAEIVDYTKDVYALIGAENTPECESEYTDIADSDIDPDTLLILGLNDASRDMCYTDFGNGHALDYPVFFTFNAWQSDANEFDDATVNDPGTQFDQIQHFINDTLPAGSSSFICDDDDHVFVLDDTEWAATEDVKRTMAGGSISLSLDVLFYNWFLGVGRGDYHYMGENIIQY